MTGLFKREPESLDGYVPVFTKEETLLGYKCEQVQVGGGFKDLDFDPMNIQYVDRHSITVLGKEIIGQKYYGYMNAFEIAAEIANEYLAKAENRGSEVFAFFQANAKSLNNSKRYWQLWSHLQTIEEMKLKVAKLQRQIERAEVMANVGILEVKAGRGFSSSERQVLLAEFNGGEFEMEES